MLHELAISNLGVIPHSTIEFSPGLSCLTGETGAGKTMIVTGLKLVCGQRSDPSKVRSGQDRADVEAIFRLDDVSEPRAEAARHAASEAGCVADENGDYVVVRTLQKTGRSRAHLSGRTVPAATLQAFSQSLVSIHGQMDQIAMLDPQHQRAILDESSPEVAQRLNDYRQRYTAWRALVKRVDEITARARDTAQEIDRLHFALNEIDAVDPQPGEDADIKEQVRRLQDIDSLRQAASATVAAIDGSVDGSFDGDSAAAAELSAAADQLLSTGDPQLVPLGEQLVDITSQLADISGEVSRFLSQLDADPQLLDTLLQRSQEIKKLTHKYAADVDGVLAWRDKARKKLAKLDVSDEQLADLIAERDKAEGHARQACAKLSAARKKAAASLAEKITKELHGLAMPTSRFEIALHPGEMGAYGGETVEFLLAGAPGEAARPISVAASGGELSRVMLAIEVNVAHEGGMTFIFDEVDSGVGGEAAIEIGKRLATLARSNQVIVVTHLPQVAAFADQHIHIRKEISEDQKTVSALVALDEEEQVVELARMLAGLKNTATGRAHAKELLAQATAFKDSLTTSG